MGGGWRVFEDSSMRFGICCWRFSMGSTTIPMRRVFLTMDMNVNVADVASFRRFESGQAAVGGMTTADDVALCFPPGAFPRSVLVYS